MTTTDKIHTLLQTAFSPLHLVVHDDSAQHAGHAGAASGGGHFRVEIVAEKFRNKTRVLRHRMVYDAVQTLLPHAIHALAINAKAPDEA